MTSPQTQIQSAGESAPDRPPLFVEARRRLLEGDLAGARHLYLDLLDRQPALAATCLHDLGLIAAMQEQHAQAKELFRHALRLDPQLPDAHANLVVACERTGDTAGLISALLEYGGARTGRGQHQEASEIFRRILALQPLHYAAATNLGNSLWRLGQGEEGAQWLLRSLYLLRRTDMGLANHLDELLPRLAEVIRFNQHSLPEGLPVGVLDRGEYALNGLANFLTEQGFKEEALACYAKLVKALPDYAQGHFKWATALLACGDFIRGWQEYEWRWHCPDFPMFNRRHLSVPLWQGEPLDGKHLLVWMEQGHGDAIQCLPLVSRLLMLGSKVTLEVVPSLLRLFAANLPGITVQARPDLPGQAFAGEGFDYRIPMMSLPLRLGLTREELPLASAYLQVIRKDAEIWRKRLAGSAGFKVGLTWSGDPKHAHDHRRSLPFASLQPLLDVPGISWHSLQVGPAQGQLQNTPGVRDFAPRLHDFADTAAAMSALDLVITVDTAAAHLAAALGKPVWLLLSALGEWRWGDDAKATPWYPSMRLFRQPRPGAWEEVVRDVREELVRQVEHNAADPRPAAS